MGSTSADELLGWREWFHYQARQMDAPERYDCVVGWAKQTLADHAGDRRPNEETLAATLRAEMRNETWSACQRHFLADGRMNNLRMYWGKRIVAMDSSPEAAWATACGPNDRPSLYGRDPSTYGNIAAMFAGAPAERDEAIHGSVATRSDGPTRHRAGGDTWLTAAASRPVPVVSVPAEVTLDRYRFSEVAF